MSKMLSLIGLGLVGFLFGNLIQDVRIRKLRKQKEDLDDEKEQLKKQLADLQRKMGEYKDFKELCDKAFSEDPKKAFKASIELAKSIGIEDDKILKSEEEGNKFFMGE